MRCLTAPACGSQDWTELTGYLASVPLRAAANVAFVVYAANDRVYPVLLLHGVRFPLNMLRSLETLRLRRRIAPVNEANPTWLRLVTGCLSGRAGISVTICRNWHHDKKVALKFYETKRLGRRS